MGRKNCFSKCYWIETQEIVLKPQKFIKWLKHKKWSIKSGKKRGAGKKEQITFDKIIIIILQVRIDTENAWSKRKQRDSVSKPDNICDIKQSHISRKGRIPEITEPLDKGNEEQWQSWEDQDWEGVFPGKDAQFCKVRKW